MNMQKKSQPQSKKSSNLSQGSPALKPFWNALEWIGLGWACFVIYKVLQTTPLYISVFESVLPSQTFFPALSVILSYIWGTFLWCGILSVCFIAGFYSLRLLNLRWHSSLENFIFSLAAGYGIVSLLLLFIAALHLLYPKLLIGIWILGVVGLVCFCMQEERRVFFKEIFQQMFEMICGNRTPFLFRLFLWIFLALSFVMAFVPELFYDALVYHLGIPNLYLQEHGLVRIPGATSRFPLLWQTLYSFGLALFDEMIPKLLHWSSGVLIVLGCGTLARRFNLLPQVGLLSGLFFISVPMVQMNIWTSGIDVGSCLFAFFSLYPICAWFSENEDSIGRGNGWIILSALMSGFAFGSKYQGGIMVLSVLLIFLSFRLVQDFKNLKVTVQQFLLFVAVATLTILPWLLKNFWDTGNPLFPFLTPLFKQLKLQKIYLDSEQWTSFIAENRRFITASWTEFWKLPWLLTFKDRNQSSLSFPGPLFLTFLCLSLLVLQQFQKNWFRILLGFLLLFFIFSVGSTHLTRYHLQGYPMLCFFYALGFTLCWEKKNLIFRIGLTILLVLILLENLQTAIFIIQNSYKPWEVLSGQESRQSYRSYTHPGLNPYPSNAMFRWMEKNLSRKTRTLFLGESKNFDLQLPYLYTDVHGKNPLLTWASQSASPEDLFKKFQEAGITHLLINFTEARRTYGYKMIQWQQPWLENFKIFWDTHVRELHREKIPERFFPSDSVVLLYEVVSEEAAKSKGAPTPNPLVLLEELMNKQ